MFFWEVKKMEYEKHGKREAMMMERKDKLSRVKEYLSKKKEGKKEVSLEEKSSSSRGEVKRKWYPSFVVGMERMTPMMKEMKVGDENAFIVCMKKTSVNEDDGGMRCGFDLLSVKEQ
ncbi:MAG: hypothetical protein QME51_00795 [Planctomycetota bacterium]|nr:hypothetical protein [Planctomycetota bacterium]